MYRIPDIKTSYRPLSEDYDEARTEVDAYAHKLAKEHGYTDYKIWTYKTYGWSWLIEINDESI